MAQTIAIGTGSEGLGTRLVMLCTLYNCKYLQNYALIKVYTKVEGISMVYLLVLGFCRLYNISSTISLTTTLFQTKRQTMDSQVLQLAPCLHAYPGHLVVPVEGRSQHV